MLFDVHAKKTKRVTHHPHPDDIQAIRAKAGPVRYQAMMVALDGQVHGRGVATASWMPPKQDWQNTVFAPLVEIAGKDTDYSGKLFGCLVWQHFLDRPERWGFGRGAKNGVPIRGMTYFQVI